MSMNNFEVKNRAHEKQTEIFLRCPECLKLYVVNPSTFQSQSPQFDCQICETRFEMSGPVTFGELVPTIKVQPVVPVEAATHCPKCGALQKSDSLDCPQCQVVFSKLDQAVSSSPSSAQKVASSPLDLQWTQLLEKFEDLKSHDQFLNLCFQAKHLDFAEERYKAVKSAAGEDVICTEMLEKIQTIRKEQQVRLEQAARTQVIWKFVYWFVLCLGVSLLILGFTQASLKNLIGLGISILVLGYGFASSFRKPVSWEDFFK